MDAMTWPLGNYYMIVCKDGDKSLRIQENDHSKFEKSRIMNVPPNPNDNGQIWMIEKVGQADDQYEIVNCMSGLVFDEESKEVRLKHGKQSKDQLFLIEQAPVQAFHKYYWIKDKAEGKRALKLEGILRIDHFNPQDEAQLFRIEQVNNQTIQNSGIIINNYTGKALDVPGATFEFKKGKTKLIQWDKNKRWNQRWHFQRTGKGVVIRSAMTGCCIDIAGESRKNGADIIQWEHTGASNQQWFAEPSGNGLFKFRSCHEPSLFLSIRKQKVDDGAEIEASSDENPTMYWRIEGCHP